jgi:hypothetical protein
VRDEAVRSDVREVGRLFADAVSATFNRARSDIKGGPADQPRAGTPEDDRSVTDGKQ